MEKEVYEFRKGCFIGGAITVLVWTYMIFVIKSHFWIGGVPAILSGLASGYIFYRFKNLITKIPVAWRYAERASGITFRKSSKLIRELFQPHPVFHSISIFIILCVLANNLLFLPDILKGGISSILIFSILGVLVGIGGLVCINLSATILAIRFKINCPDFLIKDGGYRRAGHIDLPLTYKNILYLFLISPAWLVVEVFRNLTLFFFWYLWKWAAYPLYFIGLFIFKLFVLIHCIERVMCAVDGTLGGILVTWWAYSYSSFPYWTVPLMAVLGGISGIAFGEFNRLVVLRKWLPNHIPEKYRGQLKLA